MRPMPCALLIAALCTSPAARTGEPAADGDHPYARTVQRFREAKRAGDVAALRAILSEDSRIWFDEKQGPGRRREPTGKGPWSEWDAFFNSESRTLDLRVEGNSLRVTTLEINDWYRLVDREPRPYYITYWFDAEGRIEGTLIHDIPGEPERTDRLSEFESWARQHHPGLLERLMPDGRIDPALENARLWKQRLLEWREQAGLPDPLP